MEIILKTISPVYIGSGNQLDTNDYIIKQNKLYKLTNNQLFDFVNNKMKDGRTKFKNWVNDAFKDLANERDDNKQLSALRNNINPKAFAEAYGEGAELWEYVKTHAKIRKLYRFQNNPSLIDELTKTPKDAPYIPGSTLKGSLRTALLYRFLNEHIDKTHLESMLRKRLDQKKDADNRRSRGRVNDRNFANPLIHEVFYCHTENQRSGRIKTDDEKMDLMKLLSFSDAMLHTPKENTIGVAKVALGAVERRQGIKEAAIQGQTNYIEFIEEGTQFITSIDFNINFLLQIKPLLKNNCIYQTGNKVWIGIEEKVKKLFNLNIQDITKENAEQKKEEVLQFLLKMWTKFAREQSFEDEDWLNNFSYFDKRRYSEKIKRGFNPVWEQQDNGILHLGFGTGYKGTTTILHFLKDNDLKKLFSDIMETFKIGNRPGNRGKYTVAIDRFPKSRRLLQKDQGTYAPLGWVQMIIDPPIKLESQQRTRATEASQPVVEVKPEFLKQKLKPGKGIQLDAIVSKPGSPNTLNVYLTEGKTQQFSLFGYRSILPEGRVLIVKGVPSKKLEIKEVRFVKFKK